MRCSGIILFVFIPLEICSLLLAGMRGRQGGPHAFFLCGAGSLCPGGTPENLSSSCRADPQPPTSARRAASGVTEPAGTQRWAGRRGGRGDLPGRRAGFPRRQAFPARAWPRFAPSPRDAQPPPTPGPGEGASPPPGRPGPRGTDSLLPLLSALCL